MVRPVAGISWILLTISLIPSLFFFSQQTNEMLGADNQNTTRIVLFLRECLLLGTLRGFKHFETMMRGREELILSINSPTPSTLLPVSLINKYPSQARSFHPPQLMELSDMALKKEQRVIFLIAGYAKYKCPYVWLRSCLDELVVDNLVDNDNALKLNKISEWLNKNVSLWEIVAEIVTMTIHPVNPFALDFEYIDQLPIQEYNLLSASLLMFLETLWIEAEPTVPYADQVYEDITKLRMKHIHQIHQSLKSK
ncbi:hypothetical protein BDB01DRAFT_457012 [Pilobolus umbonatus]|nr:hypothetical protein BDB01DRAFT_457012 [Pilobolus umbonatus]